MFFPPKGWNWQKTLQVNLLFWKWKKKKKVWNWSKWWISERFWKLFRSTELGDRTQMTPWDRFLIFSTTSATKLSSELCVCHPMNFPKPPRRLPKNALERQPISQSSATANGFFIPESSTAQSAGGQPTWASRLWSAGQDGSLVWCSWEALSLVLLELSRGVVHGRLHHLTFQELQCW